MVVFFTGDNPEILSSLAQQLSKWETQVLANAWGLLNRAGQACVEQRCLVLFDINHPSDHFDQVVGLVKTKFPQITLWAIFDSESAALKNELTRMGFEKIISYRDHLSELITAHEQGT